MKSSKIGVVIIGGDFQGLGVLRTFGKKNIPIVLVDNEYCIARFSRYKKSFFKSPSPSEEKAYIEFLINLAKSKRLRNWIILPNSDVIVYILSKYKTLLEEYYRIPIPHWEVIQHVYIKEKTYKVAKKHQIPIPKTYYAKGIEEIIEYELTYPLIIKPSIRDHFYNKVKIKAFLANNKDELVKIYNRVRSFINPSEILVQEFIPGGPRNLYSCCPFFKEGKIIVSLIARRLRQHPMDFGHATTFAEIVNIPELRSIAEKFLALIGYYGIAEVEFMQDPRDGMFKLIEVNPRFWGWHSLLIAAGLDLPYLLYKDMLSETIEFKYIQKNIKWIRLTTDIPTVISEIVKGKMKVREYVDSMKGNKQDAVFSIEDPLPFFIELIMLPYLWYKRGF